MTAEPLRRWRAHWRLLADGDQIETATSWLQPTHRRDAPDRPLMLKALKPESDEGRAAALYSYWAGDGAAQLIEAAGAPTDADRALVIERATGARGLVAMTLSGGDARATDILLGVARRLHAPRPSAAPAELPDARAYFAALFEQAGDIPLLSACAKALDGLLASADPDAARVLHGDLHHENVLDFGARGWLAIDPKGLIGEPAYDVANLFCNPTPHEAIVHDASRMDALADAAASALEADRRRVLGYAFAHAGLAVAWRIEDGRDPTYRLRCAELLQGRLAR